MQPVLMFDLDGTIIDNDLNTIGSAKYNETKGILEEKLGIQLGETETREFGDFYTAFNSRVMGNPGQAARILAEMMRESYGVVIEDIAAFEAYRNEKRKECYRRLARFIGDGQTFHNGSWLAGLPDGIKAAMYIVTTAREADVRQLRENPNLKVKGSSLEDLFGPRIITAADVKHKKPHPECYNLAMEREQLTPNEAGFSGVVFEDSPRGLEAARLADHGGGRLFIVGLESTLSSSELARKGAHFTAKALYAINLPEVLTLAGYACAIN